MPHCFSVCSPQHRGPPPSFPPSLGSGEEERSSLRGIIVGARKEHNTQRQRCSGRAQWDHCDARRRMYGRRNGGREARLTLERGGICHMGQAQS